MGAQKSALKTLEFLKKLFVLCLTYGWRNMWGVMCWLRPARPA